MKARRWVTKKESGNFAVYSAAAPFQSVAHSIAEGMLHRNILLLRANSGHSRRLPAPFGKPLILATFKGDRLTEQLCRCLLADWQRHFTDNPEHPDHPNEDQVVKTDLSLNHLD
jgi:hypothetical protein